MRDATTRLEHYNDLQGLYSPNTMKKNFKKRGFTLVEMIGVVALLIDPDRRRHCWIDAAAEQHQHGQALQRLSAVDQAKQSWQMFNPNATFPSDQPSRWSAISVYFETHRPFK